MRILYCIPSMEGGGTERQVTYLARELVRDGCEVHVALNRGGQNLDTLEASGATVHRLGPLSNHDPRIFLRLRQLIRVIEPDVSQCWLLQMELLGGLASMSCRVPWIFSERSSAQAYPPTAKHALRIRIAAFAAAIVSNSEAGEERRHTGPRAGPRSGRHQVQGGSLRRGSRARRARVAGQGTRRGGSHPNRTLRDESVESDETRLGSGLAVTLRRQSERGARGDGVQVSADRLRHCRTPRLARRRERALQRARQR